MVAKLRWLCWTSPWTSKCADRRVLQQSLVSWARATSQCNFVLVQDHYSGVIMGAMAYQITSLTIVYSTVNSGTDQRKHQSSASLAFVRGIHRWPVNSPHKWPGTRKMFPFDDVSMIMLYRQSPSKWVFPAGEPERGSHGLAIRQSGFEPHITPLWPNGGLYSWYGQSSNYGGVIACGCAAGLGYPASC